MRENRRVIEIRTPTESEIEAIVQLWNETKTDTYDFIPQERDRTLDEDRAFFHSMIQPRCALWIAVDAARILGFLGIRASYVDRLYVHPGAQRRGVGSALLRHAIALSPAGIELHTHVRNTKARAFYQKQGMVAVKFGVSPPPESEPDVEYHWRP
jgi:ribosomal protein S18 acetylase RimI-like enzyme